MRYYWTPILCYHRVCPEAEIGMDSRSLCVTPRQFESQMSLLKRLNYRPLSLQDLTAYLKSQKNIPSRSVVLTFDDGYLDNYIYAFPILKKFKFTATIFLVTGSIGGKNEWDSGNLPLLNEQQIDEMQSSGIFFGSHTESHPDMSRTKSDKIKNELHVSKKKLEELCSRLDIPFCYPYSYLSGEAKEWVREAGYFCGVSVDSGDTDQSKDLFEMRRVQVFPSTSLWGFWKKIQPWYPAWLEFQQRIKGQVKR